MVKTHENMTNLQSDFLEVSVRTSDAKSTRKDAVVALPWWVTICPDGIKTWKSMESQ